VAKQNDSETNTSDTVQDKDSYLTQQTLLQFDNLY